MTTWRIYADPPSTESGVTRTERRRRARSLRDEIDFEQALAQSATPYAVWMCSDALDIATGPTGPLIDAVHVDDALPGPWESDLLDLARREDLSGRAAEALGEGYQRAVTAVADEPLHAVRDAARRLAVGLAAGVSPGSAQSARMAERRLVSAGTRIRRDRVSAWWSSAVEDGGDVAGEMAQYRESLPEALSRLLSQYTAVDAVRGDHGRMLVLLAQGTDGDDVVLLEAVAAQASTREADMGVWRDGSDVQRVLLARESVPLVAPEFIGWSTSPDGAVARVWSRARASKSDGAPARADLGGTRARARRLGAALGLLHAASGDPVSLAGYLGQSRKFPAAFRAAVKSSSGS